MRWTDAHAQGILSEMHSRVAVGISDLESQQQPIAGGTKYIKGTTYARYKV